jgi:FtsH-binding integral membrane protein
MSQATGERSRPAGRGRPRVPHLTLNTDGQRHPVENVLSLFTLVAGLVACVMGFVANYVVTQPWAHIATWLGLAALLVGLYSQLVSATRQERMLIVTGLVAGFVGLCLGLAHGGIG